jgi:hypothetical protein
MSGLSSSRGYVDSVRQLLRRAGVVLAVLITTACGQVDPVLLTVAMPGCVYQGPPTMVAGDARVSLRLNGLGDAGVALVERGRQETHDDLVQYLETVDGSWSERPEWVSAVVELRVDGGQGSQGAQETVTLDPGTYSVVCLEHRDDLDPLASAAASLEVRER